MHRLLASLEYHEMLRLLEKRGWMKARMPKRRWNSPPRIPGRTSPRPSRNSPTIYQSARFGGNPARVDPKFALSAPSSTLRIGRLPPQQSRFRSRRRTGNFNDYIHDQQCRVLQPAGMKGVPIFVDHGLSRPNAFGINKALFASLM